MGASDAEDGVNPLDGRPLGTIPPAEVFGRSGLDFFRAVIAGALPMPPIAGTVPLAPVAAEAGRIVFRCLPQRRHDNPIGSVHGGFAATVLDTVMSCAAHTTLKAGEGYATIEMRVAFHRAIQAGQGELRAEGTVTSRGGRVIAAEGRIVDAQGRLMASGATTCLVFAVAPER